MTDAPFLEPDLREEVPIPRVYNIVTVDESNEAELREAEEKQPRVFIERTGEWDPEAWDEVQRAMHWAAMRVGIGRIQDGGVYLKMWLANNPMPERLIVHAKE